MGQENGAASMRDDPCRIGAHGVGCDRPKMPDPETHARLASMAPTLMPEIRLYLDRHDAKVSALFASPGQGGRALARCRSKALDGLLTSVFQVAESIVVDRSGPDMLALGAVGSYGRGLLGLKSNVDIFLLAKDSKDRARSVAEAFLSPLRAAGLSIGHQILTLEEAVTLAREDVEAATSILDFRHLAGCRALSDALFERAWRTAFSPAELPTFFRRLEERADERRRRQDASAHLLEPDVVLGAGGLRDFVEARWYARAAWRQWELRDLARLGVIPPEEGEAVEQAAEFLWVTRNRMHARAGRECDRLSVAMQEQVALDLGYPERCKAGAFTFVEAFVSDFYWHSRIVSQFRERIASLAMSRASGEELGVGD